MDLGTQDSVGADSSQQLRSISSAMSSVAGLAIAQSSGSELTALSQGDGSKGDANEARAGAEDGRSSSSSRAEPLSEALTNSSQEAVQLMSPGFRSAAALAGWDDEALMLGALNQSPAVSAGSLGDEAACEVPISPTCPDRKRDKRTPLSSARRHRRVRWLGNSGSPLVRVPMKALPLVSDNDNGSNNVEEGNCNCTSSAKGGKENTIPGAASVGRKTPESKGKLKEKTTTILPHMDQLREELSCAVCLEICFEPSTISCGHSFCGICLQSVLKMCGPKCPKCRQPLRSETLRSCRTNTVLWNTIQILFPQECAARQADKQKQQDQEAEAANFVKNNSSNLGVRPSRLQPWRTASSALSSTVNRISVMGTLRSSFQTAAQFIVDDREDGLTGRREGEVRQANSTDGLATQQEVGLQRSQSRSGRTRRSRQEQVDAALAARLQRAELMTSPNGESSIEEPREATYSRNWNHNRPRYGGTVALAAANLRTVASRATRHRTRS